MSTSPATPRATVLAGMELMRWQCDVPLWRMWCASPDASVGPKSAGPLLAMGSVGGWALLAAAIDLPPFQIASAGMALLLAGVGLVDWKFKPRNALPPQSLDPSSPLELIVTTTGLLADDVALCWDGHHQQLVYVGIGGTHPLYMLFRFRVGRFLGRRPVEVRLPVPPALEQDGTDAAHAIRRRLFPSDGAHLFRLEARRRPASPEDAERTGE